ncbi:MAG: hypothetical protein M3P23_01165 [Actinomycetota bacterium]|nr:hypothetical protein [Actinomycetota bacterium]
MNVLAIRSRILALGAAAAVLGAGMGPAQAQQLQPAVVSEIPANFTPNLAADGVVSNPAVYALAQIGNTMYVGGMFDAIQDSARTTTFSRQHMVAFDATTGAVSTTFVQSFNKPVWALLGSTDGSSLYVGGQFTTVNGAARKFLAKIIVATGQLDPSFNPVVISSGYVKEIRLVNNRLIVGGSFPKKLVALDPNTGADTGYIDLAIAGSVASNAGPTHVYKFAVSPDGTKLVALGNFTTVNGSSRARAFMVDLGATTSALSAWYYQPLTKMCRAGSLPGYMRDVDFSPDGSYFVFVSTGYISYSQDLGATLCDATSRFETNITNPFRPTWINYTGGDTLHSVAVTGAAVYVNGHQRWLDNPLGADSCVTTCVSRPGIGAIDPVTGRALPWNPGKTRGIGGKDLLATSTGLWVASDGKQFNGRYHWGIAFVPLP